MKEARTPTKRDLYDPQWEHDACGIGAVANISGRRDHTIIEYGNEVLLNLMHRGAAGSDESTGDGAGILFQIPHEFFEEEVVRLRFRLPEPKRYGVGMVFGPQDAGLRRRCEDVLNGAIEYRGLKVLGWRDVPTDNTSLGDLARAAEPVVRQVFIDGAGLEGIALERQLYLSRKRAERLVAERFGSQAEDFYLNSMSCRTLLYKGMFLAPQLFAYYPDLSDDRVVSALALVHQRYSTNTFPNWRLAQPFRLLAHNGEINTLSGNKNRMRARQRHMVQPAARRRSERPVPDPDAWGERFGVFRQRPGAVGDGRPVAAPCDDDAHSGGVRAELSHQRRQAGLLRVPRGDRWSRGTARRPWCSRMAGWWGAPSTATGFARPGTWSRPTG